MESHFLQYLYIVLIFLAIGIFTWIISKDATKFMGTENSLSKIHRVILNALNYINENMLDNGRFVYMRSVKDQFNPNLVVYNSSHHARLLYSLYLCERKLGIKSLAERRKQSAKYFVEKYVKPIGFGKYAAISDPVEENLKCLRARISSTAMALVAFSDLRGEGYISDEIFEGMGQFLLFMQMKSGQFYYYYDIENDGIVDEGNVSNTGVAPLGLLCLYEFNPKKKWLEAAKKGLIMLAEKRINSRSVSFDYNSMIATEKLFETPDNGLSEEEKQLLKAHMIKMIEQVLPKQIMDKNDNYYGAFIDNIKPVNIACIVEGLISAYNCLDDDVIRRRIMKALDVGMKFLRYTQIQRGPLKGGFPNSADWKELGVPIKNAVVRIDTVQHALAACVRFESMFK